ELHPISTPSSPGLTTNLPSTPIPRKLRKLMIKFSSIGSSILDSIPVSSFSQVWGGLMWEIGWHKSYKKNKPLDSTISLGLE
ncbi:hypothetical protein VP01_11505g1, partial [Puccinia sorghi]